jgi:hypothetical protein
MEKATIRLFIPYHYRGVKWRLSKRVVGPCGGKKWQEVLGGLSMGECYQAALEPGEYRHKVWFNNVPCATDFTVTTQEVEGERADQVEVHHRPMLTTLPSWVSVRSPSSIPMGLYHEVQPQTTKGCDA